MKKILIAFVTLVSLQAFAGIELNFFKDDRPVDGILQELNIVSHDGEDLRSSFVSLKESFYVPMTGKKESKTVFEKQDMSCEVIYSTPIKDEIGTVICTRDDRRVDGPLAKLTVELDSFGTYYITLFTSYVANMGQKVVEKSQDLGFGLVLR